MEGAHDEMATILRALAHPLRLQVLEALGEGRLSPAEFAATRGTASVSAISPHFRKLARAGLIELSSTEPRRGALMHYYRLTKSGRETVKWLGRL